MTHVCRDGWSSKHNSWEPASELKQATKMIAKFLRKFVPSQLRFKSQDPVCYSSFFALALNILCALYSGHVD